MDNPAISVVVPSHGRRLRFRWLLNALEDQTLSRNQWEVVVVHDYSDDDTRNTIEDHPLTNAGVLHHLRIPAGTGQPARQRNIGWRAAKGTLVAFTDDDCRPEPDWLERLLWKAQRSPDAIVQGATRSDPIESEIFAAPHARSLHVDPPGPYFQTCNIAYPRSVLERLGGFDEALTSGEDTDLAMRAFAEGVRGVGASDAVVYHSVEAYSLRAMIRLNTKWRHLPHVAKRHPQLRSGLPLRIFWRESHWRLALAYLGLALSRRWRPFALLALPYLKMAINARGPRKRARAAAAIELPGRIVIDTAEIATLSIGSLEHRTLLL
jgi:glycosyltransferase involved in cell wall biosynthesis